MLMLSVICFIFLSNSLWQLKAYVFAISQEANYIVRVGPTPSRDTNVCSSKVSYYLLPIMIIIVASKSGNFIT